MAISLTIPPTKSASAGCAASVNMSASTSVSARNSCVPPQRKVQKKAAPVRRQREKVSLGTLCGFMALAAMVALMIMCRAQLTEISAQVVSVQKEISALEDEHVALLTRYEKTFDLTTIKEAAAAAGMAKPSASQVYYIDLSEPDSVVVYQQKSQNVLSRVLTSLGNGVCAVVEYFK